MTIFQDKLYRLMLDSHDIPFLNHNSRFFILTMNFTLEFRQKIAAVLEELSITNYEIILDTTMDIKSTNLIEETPKKSSNLTHNILACYQSPIVIVKGNQVHSKFMHFLKVITETENSTLNFTLYSKNTTMTTIYDDFNRLMSERKIEISLNTWTLKNDASPKLMTYEQSGSCAIAPMPGKYLKTGTIFKV